MASVVPRLPSVVDESSVSARTKDNESCMLKHASEENRKCLWYPMRLCPIENGFDFNSHYQLLSTVPSKFQFYDRFSGGTIESR
jgi:hypothetical protein